MKRHLQAIVIYGTLIGHSFFFFSCQQLSQSITDTFNTKPEEASQAGGAMQRAAAKRISGFVADAEAIDDAERLLRELPQYRGKPIYLYADIHFYDDGRIMAKLQHPDKPDYIDAYDYRGGQWSDPTPVQLSVRDNILDRLVALDSVPLQTAAKVTANYNEKAASIEGASPTEHVYLIIHHGVTRWYPNRIDGSREAWDIFFNQDGSIASFVRN